jgi:hypothetical protein
MLATFQIVTTLLVAVAMALSLAHALELPGKKRLGRETYFAVQPIYYPGFTIGGGVGEFGGTLATVALLILTPVGTAAFWLTLAALVCLLGMQAVYWTMTHPVNKFWLRREALQGAGERFFAAGKADARNQQRPWTALRDRWEFSHVARAVLAFVGLALLVIAIARS